MALIECESDRPGNLDGHSPDLHANAERVQRVHEFFVESGNRVWHETESSGFTEAGFNFQSVADEIKAHLENPFFVGHRGSGQASGRDVQSGSPPMIYVGAEGKADHRCDCSIAAPPGN